MVGAIKETAPNYYVFMRAASLYVFLAAIACCQSSPHYVEIKLPRGVDSAKVFIRYLLNGGTSPIGGWVDPRPDVSSYFIATTQNGAAASHLKALVYAPGCGIQNYDVPISGSSVQQVPFECRTVPSKWITGVVTGLADSRIVANYSAQWVEEFFHQDVATLIPVGQANYWTDEGRFRMLVPDFSGYNRSGEIQFWVTNAATGKVIARLLPDIRSAIGEARPDQIKFRICGSEETRGHDRFGFAIRGQEHFDCEGLVDH